jgi:hypothetical protein
MPRKVSYFIFLTAAAISMGMVLGIMTRFGWFNSTPSSYSWGGRNNEMSQGIWSDSNYLYTCGSTLSYGAGSTDIAVVEWDFNGTVVWNSTWGGSDHESGNGVCGNGTHLFIVGWTESYGAGLRDAVLVQWDLSGNFLQFNTWGGPFYDEASSIWQNSSEVYICGTTWSYGAGGSDLFLMKMIPGVAVIWNHTWGGPALEYGCTVLGIANAIYTAGNTNSCGAGKSDFALVKWDEEGNVVWNRTWGGSGEDICKSIWSDGHFIYACGTCGSFETANRSVLVKWDLNGNIIWNCSRGGVEMSGSIGLWGNAGKIYTCGWIGMSPTANTHLSMEEWDPNGNIMNMWSWGEASSSSLGQSVWGHEDQVYVTGYTSGDGSEFDFILLKWSVNTFLPGFPFLPLLPILVIAWISIIHPLKRKRSFLEKQKT